MHAITVAVFSSVKQCFANGLYLHTVLIFSMKNKSINSNPEQLKAVASIALGNTRLPYIIYGPPGTGKTVTMVEAIKQVRWWFCSFLPLIFSFMLVGCCRERKLSEFSV